MENEENKHKAIELRSEEVQEVMNQIPPWILRRGITALFVIVIALLIGSWFFKYPDVIKAEIIITSLEPPANIIARSTGKIAEIYVRNNQYGSAQTPLAVIQSPANSDDIHSLIRIMSELETFGYSDGNVDKLFSEEPLSLGTIQTAYASFLSCLSDYQNYKKLNYYPHLQLCLLGKSNPKVKLCFPFEMLEK